MKNSCLSRALSALPKIVLDQEPAIALRVLSQDNVVRACASQTGSRQVVPGVPPYRIYTLSLVSFREPSTSFSRYDAEVWKIAADRSMIYSNIGYSLPIEFPSGGEILRMSGDPEWFTLSRRVFSDEGAWWEVIPYEVKEPEQLYTIELPDYERLEIGLLCDGLGLTATYA